MAYTFKMLPASMLAFVSIIPFTAGCGSVSSQSDAAIDTPADQSGIDRSTNSDADLERFDAADQATSDGVSDTQSMDAEHQDAADAADGRSVLDGDSDGAPPADAAHPDAILPDGGTEHGCQQRTYDDAKGVFVVGAASATAFCGDRGMPCATISAGVARAKDLGRSIVYVAAGTYVEAVTLAPGVRIEGDWSVFGSTWTPLCDKPGDAVAIEAPSGNNVTVVAKDLGGGASLAWLTVKSKANAEPGQSLYGIFATGTSTTLKLEGVKIVVANAGAGRAGEPGAGGVNGSGAGCPLASASDGASAPGAGASGADGTPSTFTATGYVTASGTAGGDGQAGHNGPIGSAGACLTNCAVCDGNTACKRTDDSCGGAGLPGCGGGAGKGGGGGGGGGSSIALYVWGATVDVVGGAFKAGNGGNGGNGGGGGGRGLGAIGARGQDSSTACRQCEVKFTPPTGSTGPGTYSCSSTLIGGGQGGAPAPQGGGNGGDGGRGGGGAGGSSFAIFKGGQGVVAAAGSPELAAGQPGAGGGPANAGAAKDIGP